MTYRILGAVLCILGLSVIATPVLLLPVCEYQGHERMVCTYTGKAEIGIGIIIVFTAIGIFFSTGSESFRWPMLSVAAAGAEVLFLPSVIGYCRNSTMPCNYGTVPALRLEGLLIVVTAVIGIGISRMKKGKGS